MLKRILTVLVFLLLGVGVAVAILLFSESDEISDVNVDRLIAEKVSVRTLSEEITISGEMRREELQSINSVSAGRLTSLELEEGDMVDAFTTLFTLDGRPSVSVNGDFSFYRELNVGSQGPDVEQLETILEMAGYEVGIVDQFYTEETRNGLALWQDDFGFKGGITEVDELVNFSLVSNPFGYSLGAVNTVGVTIGSPLSEEINDLGERQGIVISEIEEIPTVRISATPSVVLEGGKVTVEIISDPAPKEDIEVDIEISGDVVEGKDFELDDKKFLILAGSESVEFELDILSDDELEANEDLEISIVGGFENEENIAPHDLKIYDLETEIEELDERYSELSDSERIFTDVEQELVDEQIISGTQAWEYDFSPSEAENLMNLKDAFDEAERDYRNQSITAAAKAKALDAYEDALEKAQEERTESEQDEFERLAPLLKSKNEELRIAKASRWLLAESDMATVVIDDPEAPDMPVLVIASSSDYVTEPGVALFYVETTDDLAEELIVFFELVGEVEPGEDYIIPSGDVTMAKGSKKTSISIEIRDDDLVEVDESLTVRLLEAKNSEYQLSSQVEATVLVQSPDLPELSITGGGTILEGETAVVTVRADQAVTVDTSINYSVSGTAQQGVDYEVLEGSALMKAGEVSVEIPIRSLRDDVFFMPGDMIVADWPARVGGINFEKEDLVSSGVEILSLTEPTFKVALFASPTDRAKLEIGQKVTIEIDAGDQESDGIISQLDDAVTKNGASELYEGEVEALSDLIAVEGAVVAIDVVVAEVVDAIVVPIAAVLTENSSEKIRVVTRDGTVERRVVQTGMLDGAWVEIISGVSPEEFVIIEIDRS
ncbi:MAG: Calx-beta domain-containing protein [Acidimicrobiales bacterium]